VRIEARRAHITPRSCGCTTVLSPAIHLSRNIENVFVAETDQQPFDHHMASGLFALFVCLRSWQVSVWPLPYLSVMSCGGRLQAAAIAATGGLKIQSPGIARDPSPGRPRGLRRSADPHQKQAAAPFPSFPMAYGQWVQLLDCAPGDSTMRGCAGANLLGVIGVKRWYRSVLVPSSTLHSTPSPSSFTLSPLSLIDITPPISLPASRPSSSSRWR
jgi:hypothetical protein